MKQYIRPFVLGGIAVLLSLVLNSCSGLGNLAATPLLAGGKELGDPSTHAVIFGVIADEGTMVVEKGPAPASTVFYMQINPKSPTGSLETNKNFFYTYRGVYYSEPVLAGGSYKLIYSSYGSGRQQYYTQYGIAGRNPWDLKAVHPGLNYLGSWIYSKKDEEGKEGFSLTTDPKLIKLDSPDELECLQIMLPKFAGTNWEPVIQARIKEFSK
jgi:hypothetical protein